MLPHVPPRPALSPNVPVLLGNLRANVVDAPSESTGEPSCSTDLNNKNHKQF